MSPFKEEIDLRIDKEGRVIIHVSGPTGKERLERIQMVAELVGELDQNYKSPYPHPAVFIVSDTQQTLEQKAKG